MSRAGSPAVWQAAPVSSRSTSTSRPSRASRKPAHLLAVIAVVALALTGCGGPGSEKDAPPAPQASGTNEPGAPEPTPAAAASRLTGAPNGSGVCLDGFASGRTIAFTGPELRAVGGPITVTDVALAQDTDASIRTARTAAALYTYERVRHPGLVTADSLDDLDVSGLHYIDSSKGPLIGTEFEAGKHGFVPLVEARVEWPKGQFPRGVEFSIAQPDLTITYTDSDGNQQSFTEVTGVTFHSAERGCKND